MRRRALPGVNPWPVGHGKALLPLVILFISSSGGEGKPPQDWAAPTPIPRRCPTCDRDSIWGHGWRSKQAHDTDHDWIRIRRGYCKPCKLSFTFLPALSLPYSHYSGVARSETLRRRFLDHRVWEESAPKLKSDRCPDLSTLRRWCHALDATPRFSHLRSLVKRIGSHFPHAIRRWPGRNRLCWTTLYVSLQRYWPLRL